MLGFGQTSFTDDDCSNIADFTTSAFINESSIQDKTYSYPVLLLPTGKIFNHFITSDISTSVDAVSNFQYDESGYYLINVISTFNNNYVVEDSIMSKVSCVASKQYSAGDFITAYADSGITYQHSGSPILFNNVELHSSNLIRAQDQNDIE
jgi:hypothetical protein